MFLPGIAFFNKVALSDAFMFVGHCQYEKKSWQNHNFIRGGIKLTVPVHNTLGQSINETKIAGEHWKRKHLKAIELAYSKALFFDKYFDFFSTLLAMDYPSLGHMNMVLTDVLAGWLFIDAEIWTDERFNIEGHKTDMLISMCRAVGADHYLSSPGETYVDREKMKQAGIKHSYQILAPEYENGSLSIIDLLFTKGPEAAEIVRGAGWVGPTI